MKNLNKKICAVALSGMMALGGLAASGRIAKADGPSIDNIPNVKAHKFVHDLCKKRGVVIVKYSKDESEIDAFLKDYFKKDPQKKRRLEDVISFERDEYEAFEEYLEDKIDDVRRDKVPKRLYRVQYGIEQYLILVNNFKIL